MQEAEALLEGMAKRLPRDHAARIRFVMAEMETAFLDREILDRNLCTTVALATWVLELDKVGRLHMEPRDVAYVYQAGRIAAQELDIELHPRLHRTIEALLRAQMQPPAVI